MDEELEGIFDQSIEPENIEDSNYSEDIFDTNVESKANDDLLSLLLKERGIVNNKLTIYNEDNTKEEIAFSELSLEEQLQVLQAAPETTINSDAAELVEYLKENNLTMQEYLDNYKQAIIQSVTPQEEIYEIDAYTDEELYLLDLKNKYDLTDEELTAELEKELTNKDLFDKKVTKLRTEYKQLADDLKTQQEQEQQRTAQEEYDKFAQQMVTVAQKTSDLYGIELEDGEKNNVLSYILELDGNGVSNFYKALQNPEQLYKAAWFLRYGKEAFDAVHGEYEAQIKAIKKDSGKVIIKPKQTKEKSIFDI